MFRIFTLYEIILRTPRILKCGIMPVKFRIDFTRASPNSPKESRVTMKSRESIDHY